MKRELLYGLTISVSRNGWARVGANALWAAAGRYAAEKGLEHNPHVVEGVAPL